MSKIKKCVGKEAFQRMNYLYQISNDVINEDNAVCAASFFYSNLMVNISKKTVQRIDISTKRSICKKCRSILLPGLTAKVRIKKKQIKWTCLKCNTTKIFSTKNKNYQPWPLRKESLVEVLNYGHEQTIKTPLQFQQTDEEKMEVTD